VPKFNSVVSSGMGCALNEGRVLGTRWFGMHVRLPSVASPEITTKTDISGLAAEEHCALRPKKEDADDNNSAVGAGSA